jgi:cellulose synthase/poly-beta-1,6-N-acetylglucosamine synthase-like glycosyltransferase
MQQMRQAQRVPDSAAASAPAFTVIVPTFRRTAQLMTCLRALAVQELPPAQVIVVVRDEDAQTKSALAEFEGPRPDIVIVNRRGQTHALNSALRRATGDIVAFTDDDAAPRPQWLAQLAIPYADPRVGGVGGKVIVPRQTAAGSSARLVVGTVSPFGRPLGNHHLGDGDARDVQWLKGVNMSYRRELCRFDESLRGAGAQVANDSDIALRIHAAGWRIVYAPEAAVDHYAGPRFDADGRDSQSIQAMRDAVFNETLVLLRWLPPRDRRRVFAYLLAVGVPKGAGPLGACKAVVTGRRTPADAVVNCRHATAARLEAWREWRSTRNRKDDTPRAGR